MNVKEVKKHLDAGSIFDLSSGDSKVRYRCEEFDYGQTIGLAAQFDAFGETFTMHTAYFSDDLRAMNVDSETVVELFKAQVKNWRNNIARRHEAMKAPPAD